MLTENNCLFFRNSLLPISQKNHSFNKKCALIVNTLLSNRKIFPNLVNVNRPIMEV